jgi:hypothetical protein
MSKGLSNPWPGSHPRIAARSCNADAVRQRGTERDSRVAWRRFTLLPVEPPGRRSIDSVVRVLTCGFLQSAGSVKWRRSRSRRTPKALLRGSGTHPSFFAGGSGAHFSPNHAGAKCAFAGDWARGLSSPWSSWPVAVRAPPAHGVVAAGSPCGPARAEDRAAGRRRRSPPHGRRRSKPKPPPVTAFPE